MQVPNLIISQANNMRENLIKYEDDSDEEDVGV